MEESEGIRMFNEMLDKILNDRRQRASFYYDSNAEDATAEYLKNREQAAMRMGKLKAAQDAAPDPTQAQSDIFRREFYARELPDIYKVSNRERSDILTGSKKNLVEFIDEEQRKKREIENIAQEQRKLLEAYKKPTGKGGNRNSVNKDALKKMILEKMLLGKGMENAAKKNKVKKPTRNTWVAHVKNMSKKLGITYKQAMSDPRVKAAF